MKATSPQTCSIALKNCSAESLPDFVKQLDPVIGKAGGRKFIELPQGKKNPSLQGSLCLNDIVKQLNLVWKDLAKSRDALDPSSVKAILNTIKMIKDIDKSADLKLSKSNVLIRMLTAIRSFLGNIGYNRNHVLQTIEKAISSPRTTLSASNTNATTAVSKADKDVAALIKMMSNLDHRNYRKNFQTLENTPEEIICAALRLSFNNDLFQPITSMMGVVKIRAVFIKAAEEARESNDYLLFGRLINSFTGMLRKDELIASVKCATNSDHEKIESIRVEVNKHVNNNEVWKSFYNSMLDEAKK